MTQKNMARCLDAVGRGQPLEAFRVSRDPKPCACHCRVSGFNSRFFGERGPARCRDCRRGQRLRGCNLGHCRAAGDRDRQAAKPATAISAASNIGSGQSCRHRLTFGGTGCGTKQYLPRYILQTQEIHLGPAKATTATARKLACIVYNLLKYLPITSN
jgi:hypothetical protein